jgi:2-dehydro-3-deoxyphosphogalactonate aldolase
MPQPKNLYESTLDKNPIIGIVRGITPERVVGIAEVMMAAGIKVIEVPLNSPDALKSIELLAKNFDNELLCGAGTVTTTQQVNDVQNAGGQLIVSPNCNPAVIKSCIDENLICIPGIATASEAFCAIESGARRLKLFPAQTYGPGHLGALRAVLPADIKIYPVGGIDEGNTDTWLNAGASGFGFGSSLYQMNDSVRQVQVRALALCKSMGKFYEA